MKKKINASGNNKQQTGTGNRALLVLFILFTCIMSFNSCSDDEATPKPRGYLRLSFPEKKYVKYDSVYPFTFEIPVYSNIGNQKEFNAETFWLNLNFPSFNGTIHLTYKSVHGNIDEFLQESYMYASKHQIKASGIEEQPIARPDDKVYGLMYDIEGNAASPFQFFLTDSTSHFIRGALYFNAVPNTDSIAPVISFIKKDIYHFIETFKWKKEDASAGLPKAVNKKQAGSK